MADRQYGILPGTTLTGTPPPPQQPARSASPTRQGILRTSHEVESPPPPPVHRSIARKNLQQPPVTAWANTSDISDYQPQDGGMRAIQGLDNLYKPATRTPSPQRRYDPSPQRQAHTPEPYLAPTRPEMSQNRYSEQSLAPLMANQGSPGLRPVSPGRLHDPPIFMARQSYRSDGYDEIDPTNIADDGDDGFEDHTPRPRSRLAFGAAPAGGLLKPFGSRNTSNQYSSVPAMNDKQINQRSAWLEEQQAGTRRRKRTLWIIASILLLAIIAGAIVAGVLASRKASGSSGSSSSGSHSGGLYDIDSSEVKQVMNNNDLHRVFPAMDYTPLNAQYPDCLSNPLDQNNITLDVAILSQLSPAIRLYGTDCEQTERVLSAIDRLKMNDTMSVWLGVWLDTNTTTNARQLTQLYSILDKYPSSHFAGIIVGNEVLFRQDMTLLQLGNVLSDVRSNLTAKKITLPVGTADLGDKWTADLAAKSDIVMANVHPFFAGVTPDVAPGWTYNFWQQHDNVLATKATTWPKSIISEVGWPSEGGNDCGGATTCPSGSGAVASVDNMNKFMDGFVCQSMTNSTTYFWFEAFDEPWKVKFDTATEKWESKWGLMDENRNLKSGLKIPSCDGKTLTKAY